MAWTRRVRPCGQRAGRGAVGAESCDRERRRGRTRKSPASGAGL